MWEGEKIHGKDREEKCPIPAAILLLYQRWIQDAEFFAVLTKCYSLFLALISESENALFSFNIFQSGCNGREIHSNLEVKCISVSISLMNGMPETVT